MARLEPVPITVRSTLRIAERVQRLDFTGMSNVVSERPASYLSLWFSPPDQALDAPGRTPKRTFTPRSLDPVRRTMTVEFVLHGPGTATDWAVNARSGDTIWAGETKGGFDRPPDTSFVVMVGDETAIPAIGTIVEHLDGDVGFVAVIEVADSLDERAVSDTVDVDPIWLHRGDDIDRVGQVTLNLLGELQVPADAFWWIAGERESIREMRDLLVEDRAVPKKRLSLNAYWRLATVDPRHR